MSSPGNPPISMTDEDLDRLADKVAVRVFTQMAAFASTLEELARENQALTEEAADLQDEVEALRDDVCDLTDALFGPADPAPASDVSQPN